MDGRESCRLCSRYRARDAPEQTTMPQRTTSLEDRKSIYTELQAQEANGMASSQVSPAQIMHLELLRLFLLLPPSPSSLTAFCRLKFKARARHSPRAGRAKPNLSMCRHRTIIEILAMPSRISRASRTLQHFSFFATTGAAKEVAQQSRSGGTSPTPTRANVEPRSRSSKSQPFASSIVILHTF